MAVIATPPFLTFQDSAGVPYAGGKLYTYNAGTLSDKITYADAAATTPLTNPIILDSAGRATFFIEGSYKYRLFDADDNFIEETDNITSFTTTGDSADAFFESFSGDGTTDTFVLSENLGSDEKLIMVFVDNGLNEYVTNGTFVTDTDWTKGSGWSIGSGVASASSASSNLSQDAAKTLIEGQSYTVTYTISNYSAGSVSVSVGGETGTSRSADGTYTETLIAKSTQIIQLTGSSFTGDIDNIAVTEVNGKGFEILSPSEYVLNSTSLELNEAPEVGTNNIQVWAPSRLAGAAAASADSAAASASEAANSANAAQNGAGFRYQYSSTTTEADPTNGFFRLNNATPSSATEIFISTTTDQTQDISDTLATWDDSDSTIKGVLRIFNQGDFTDFVTFNITGTATDNTTWFKFTISNVDSGGSLTNLDTCSVELYRTGDKGDQGAAGNINNIGSQPTATITAADKIIFADVSDSDNSKNDTVQGILDLVPDSGMGVLLGSYTASNATSVDIGSGLDLNAAIDDTYDEYKLVFVNVQFATSSAVAYVRFSNDGGSTFLSSSLYAYAGTYVTDQGSSADFVRGQAQSQIQLSGTLPKSDIDQRWNGEIIIYTPASAGVWPSIRAHLNHYTNTADQFSHVDMGGTYKATGSIDALRFFGSSGNITTGTFYLYGIKKS